MAPSLCAHGAMHSPSSGPPIRGRSRPLSCVQQPLRTLLLLVLLVLLVQPAEVLVVRGRVGHGRFLG